MAKKRSIINLADEYEKLKEPNVSVNDKPKADTNIIQQDNSNIVSQQEADKNQEAESQKENAAALLSTKASAIRSFKRRQTVEETHTRQTYLIRNDLLKLMDKLSKNKDRGFKTQVVNSALEVFLHELIKNDDKA